MQDYVAILAGDFLSRYGDMGSCCRGLLAGKIEDLAVDRPKDDVEESGDGSSSCFNSDKIVPLHHMVFIQEHGDRNGALIEDVPLSQRLSVMLLQYFLPVPAQMK